MILDKAKLPEGWRIVRLGDVAEVTFSTVDKKTIDGEFPVQLCNYTDVFYSRRIHPGMDFMSATASPVECERWVLKKGDVLFTKDSETPDEIGVPAYVSEALPNVLCGYHLGLARPQTEYVQGIFLAESLASRPTARQFARIANGVTRFGLTLSATRNLPILLPPLAEQRAIAAVLDSIDEAIERTEAVIVATERLRDALLHELLTRGLPGKHTEFKQVPGIGTIPASWKGVRLGDVLTLDYGISLPERERRDGHVPVIGSAGLVGHHSKATVKAPGIVVGRKGSIGSITWVADDFVPIDTTYIAAPADGQTDLRWLYHLLTRENLAKLNRATGVPGLNRDDVYALKRMLPPVTEQQAIAVVLDTVAEAIEREQTRRDALQSLKAAASEALLTGKVQMP